MAREEDRAPGIAAVAQQLDEATQHERVESLTGLVEDQQLGVVLDSLQDAEFLAHALRVRAHGALQVGIRETQKIDSSST